MVAFTYDEVVAALGRWLIATSIIFGVHLSAATAQTPITALSDAQGESEKICHHLFEEFTWAEVGVEGCKAGDILIAQITANIAPAAIVARFCDFRFSIFNETYSGQVSIVCKLRSGGPLSPSRQTH